MDLPPGTMRREILTGSAGGFDFSLRLLGTVARHTNTFENDIQIAKTTRAGNNGTENIILAIESENEKEQRLVLFGSDSEGSSPKKLHTPTPIDKM